MEIPNESIEVPKKEVQKELIIIRNADNESEINEGLQNLEAISKDPNVSEKDREMAESELSIQKQINALIDKQMGLNISDQTNYDIRSDTYRKCLPIISKYINILGDVNGSDAQIQFDQTLFAGIDDFENILKVESDLEMWREVHKRYHFLF
ncbi:hypothetical protein M9Y10_008162 [Tritrichomonas musculus]|uniref:Uncharacterized protein n=1 Tax=Tritrichomonas musculus TaxID=1915356 RepID=A0ABR2IYI0_9EUKA